MHVMTVRVRLLSVSVGRRLIHSGGGSIVNIASISSFIAQPKFTPYNTSKGAIVQLTRCIAMDYGPFKIRCNSVCPGTIGKACWTLCLQTRIIF